MEDDNFPLGINKVFLILYNSSDGDQMEGMDTVSLQAVTLADGSTAYIQHDSKTSFSDGQIMDGQVIQLEDGSAAYVQHVSMHKTGKRQTQTGQTMDIMGSKGFSVFFSISVLELLFTS